MKFKINERLLSTFKATNKNYNYLLNYILNSLDVECCKSATDIVEEFKLLGTTVETDIDDNNVSVITQIFGKCDSFIIEKLLWVALLFPEI